jgi:tRNA pseudouridine38-40 synthase
MRTISLAIAYCGDAYKGFQCQPNETTVQGVIEKVLSKIYVHDVKVKYSGRTDAGVNAKKQIVTYFDYNKVPLDKLVGILNNRLPDNVSVESAKITDEGFDPRRNALEREYEYWLYFSNENPFISNYMHYQQDLDIVAMEKALKEVVGEHDFSKLCSEPDRYKSTVRQIFDATLTKEEYNFVGYFGECVKIKVVGNSFLYHMVRKLVGLLLEVGRGNLPLSDFILVVDGSKLYSWKMAPPKALFLSNIIY